MRPMRPADATVWLGLVLWFAAQMLPAYTQPSLSGESQTTIPGIAATLLTWLNAILGHSWALAFAWSANLWLAAELVAWATGRRRAAIGLGSVSAVAGAVGMWVLLSGGLPEYGTFGQIADVGIGSWLWVGGMLAVLAGVAWPKGFARIRAVPGSVAGQLS